MVNEIKQLAGQTAVYGLSSIVGRLLNYLLVPLYTRVFTAGQYGVVTEIYAYVAFLIVILTYGMETAFFRFSSSSEDKRRVYGTSLMSLLSTSSAFILLMVIFAQPVANWLHYPDHAEYVIWFAIIVGIDALSAIPLARLREKGKAFLFAFVNLASIAVNIGLNLFFLVYCRHAYIQDGPDAGWLVTSLYDPDTGVGYVFISNLVATIVKVLLLLPYVIVKPCISFVLLKSMFRYSFPLLVAGLAGIAIENIDRILLKRLLMDGLGEKATLEQIGIYGACYKISLIISIFIQAFRFASEPYFFARFKEKDAPLAYSRLMKYFVIACSAIFLVIILFLDSVMLFVGESFRMGAGIVPVLLMAYVCLGIYYNLSVWYKLTGKTAYGAWIALMGAVIVVVLNCLWIPRKDIFGEYYAGPAWATLICFFTMAAVSYVLGQKHYPVPYSLTKMLGYPLLALVFYFFSVAAESKVGGNAMLFLNPGLIAVFAGVVYLAERQDFHKSENS